MVFVDKLVVFMVGSLMVAVELVVVPDVGVVVMNMVMVVSSVGVVAAANNNQHLW